MSKKLYIAIDINDPSTWQEVEEGMEVDIDDIHKKVDNIKELVHRKEIDDVEDIYNSLEYVESVLEERVPLYIE
ncbi:hypothetical protein AAK964_12260 [Tissierella praeacuta]|uniref:hypothetical protein n=1 Tax=Tissierella praeacuta TaxID=43131 RepID=UPI003513FB33